IYLCINYPVLKRDKLNECPHEEIASVTGVYYTRTSIEEQVETEVKYAEDLIKDFSNKQTTDDIEISL
ncbi:MAG TPA: hypothetical protein DCY94_03425, partial [Firmicutes bacterium]|nr:hypothetical protein [Bacillota bacterium]